VEKKAHIRVCLETIGADEMALPQIESKGWLSYLSLERTTISGSHEPLNEEVELLLVCITQELDHNGLLDM